LQGLKYRSMIEQMVAQTPDGVIKTRLDDLCNKVKQWSTYIYELAKVLMITSAILC